MGLFNSLISTANTMSVFERSLATVQNNVANASTPGYARQRQELLAQRFDPDVGIVGGVSAGETVSYRSQYAERAVRGANSDFGKYDQIATDLGQLEPLFPITADAGLPAAMNRFFEAASQASVSPNSSTSREVLLDRARQVASSFNELGRGLNEARTNIGGEIRSTVNRVNQIASTLADLNTQRAANGFDAGLDAKANQLLEELSGLVNYDTVEQDDGSLALYAGGSLLVIGDQSYPQSLDSSGGSQIIRDSQGRDVTDKLTGGRLSGLLQTYNTEIPGLQAGVNQLATEFADGVNTVLDGGLDANGARPVQPLFDYNPTDPSGSLTVTSLTSDQLALASNGAPGGNGNALQLVDLASVRNASGKTFTQSYGDLTASLGRKVSTAQEAATTRGQVYAQAKSIREEAQGVSLNEEAAQLIQAQRAYQAAAQLFRTLNELTEAAINLGR